MHTVYTQHSTVERVVKNSRVSSARGEIQRYRAYGKLIIVLMCSVLSLSLEKAFCTILARKQ